LRNGPKQQRHGSFPLQPVLGDFPKEFIVTLARDHGPSLLRRHVAGAEQHLMLVEHREGHIDVAAGQRGVNSDVDPVLEMATWSEVELPKDVNVADLPLMQ